MLSKKNNNNQLKFKTPAIILIIINKNTNNKNNPPQCYGRFMASVIIEPPSKDTTMPLWIYTSVLMAGEIM